MVKRDKELRQAFADRVNRLREERGLSWKELAALVGTDVSSLWRWRSRNGPRLEGIVALSVALEVTTDFLLLGHGPDRPEPSALRRAIDETPRSLRVAFCQALLGDAVFPSSSRGSANPSHPQPERKS